MHPMKTWNILGGKLMEREEVTNIAKKYGKTSAQVLLKWATQQGFSVIPKSTNVEHMKMNLEAVADINDNLSGENMKENHTPFVLSDDDMKQLDSLDQSFLESSDEKTDKKIVNEKARLCWLRDPLKMLDFE